MKKSVLISILSTVIILFSLNACQNNELGANQNQGKFTVRYLAEEACCGNLIILDSKTIARICDLPDDTLLKAVNLIDFEMAQNLQDGDVFTIEYELTEECQAFCEVTCNRWHAIPVKLTSIE